MEFRKLISFGKTSFVMSIPKAWVQKNKLSKGDLLSLEERDGTLVLSPKTDGPSKIEQKEIIIDTTGKEMNRIVRETVSAYINNFNPIIVRGKDLTEKAPEIRKALGDLIALEVMEQNSDRIVAKDFLNMDKISIESSIKKMDMIIRSILSDSKVLDIEQDYINIYHRDQDINRLNFLIYRAIKHALDNPDALKTYHLSLYELVHLWMIANTLEKIADHSKRIARDIHHLSKDKISKKKLLDLYGDVETIYLNTMKMYNKRDIDGSYELAKNKKRILLRFNKAAKRNKDNWILADTINKMQQMLVEIHEINKTTYLLLTK